MKQFLVITVLSVLVLFSSCSEDEILTDAEYGNLSFAIKVNNDELKSANQLSQVSHAVATINKDGKVFQDYELKKIKITNWGEGQLVCDEIKLWTGIDYELVRFELQNEDNKTLFASPLKGSTLESKVSNPLGISFAVKANITSPLEVEVISSINKNPQAFGFVQFNVKIITDPDKEMVLVQGGTYDLEVGLTKNGENIEGIHYNVTLDDFYIGKYEVTQEQWFDIMGTKPKGFVGGNFPANNIEKSEALEFIKKLNSKTGENYRLPTEAEWIYAARGGNKTKGFSYSGSNNLDEVAWHKNNAGMQVHLIGQKLPNELDLYDMTGNVWEWCSDTYDDTGRLAYDNLDVTNPKNEKGDFIVARGGAFNLEWHGFFSINPLNHPFWRGTNRNVTHAEANFESIGFRLVKSK